MNIYNDVLNQISGKEIIKLLRKLVRTPSTNPPGNEEEMANLVYAKMKAIGMEVQTFAAEPGRPNVIGRLRGREGSPVLILNTHMDTVPPGDLKQWTFHPFSAKVKNNRIYGRGACDNKGSLAAMIMAASALKKADVELRGDLVLTAVVDEEMGGDKGTRYLVEKGLIRGDMGITCGVSNLDTLYIASRGSIWLEIVTKGKLSHASMPHLGINAVEKMAKVILAMKELKLKLPSPHKLLPSPTIAPGTTIAGGTKVNMIPDACKATFDIRIVPEQSFKEVLDEIKGCIEGLKLEDKELQAEVRVSRLIDPAEISEDERIVRIAKEATKYVTGREPKIAGISGATDARFLINQARIPTIVNFGPGRLNQCHVANEYIEIDQVVAATKIYALTALQACGYGKYK